MAMTSRYQANQVGSHADPGGYVLEGGKCEVKPGGQGIRLLFATIEYSIWRELQPFDPGHSGKR